MDTVIYIIGLSLIIPMAGLLYLGMADIITGLREYFHFKGFSFKVVGKINKPVQDNFFATVINDNDTEIAA